MKPRILFVDHVGVLGGAELSLLDIARHFKQTSQVVLLDDGPFRKRLEQAGVAVHVVSAPGIVKKVAREGGLGQDLRAIPGVLRLAWKLSRLGRGFDVLYANSQKSMMVAALAGKMARRPVIWHLRDILTEDHFSTLHRKLAVLWANVFVKRVIANSQATQRAFIASGGRGKKIHVVYNGFDASRFEGVRDEDVEQLRAELGLSDAPIVGLFSRLAPWKGQHVLIRALASLPDVQAILVGKALFDVDRQYVAELHSLAEQLGIAGRIHFLGFRGDVPLLLKLTDVVVHTSVALEPFGRVIVEGMLAGRPVIATRAGGALEIIDSGKTGQLVPPGDPAALAEAIKDLLEHPEKTEALSRNGYEAAVRRFSLPSMIEEITVQIEAVAS